MRFLNELTEDQIRKLISAIGIPWQDYEANSEGWITFSDTDLIGYPANSSIGINIRNGGTQDHYLLGFNEGTGDIIKLKAAIEADISINDVADDDVNAAIRWAKSVLAIPDEIQKPQIPDGYYLPVQYLQHQEDGNKYVRCPQELLKSELSASEKIVWMGIFSRCINKNYSYPGIRKLAEDTGLSSRTVLRSIKILKSVGLLKEHNTGKGKVTVKFPLISDYKTINAAIRHHRGQSVTTDRGQSVTTPVDNLSPDRGQSVTRSRLRNNTKEKNINTELEKESYGLNQEIQPHQLPFYSEADKLDPAYQPLFRKIRDNRVAKLSARTQRKIRGGTGQVLNGNQN